MSWNVITLFVHCHLQAVLACPSCKKSLTPHYVDISLHALLCRACQLVYPQHHGFIYFESNFLYTPKTVASRLKAFYQVRQQAQKRYEQHVNLPNKRKALDSYALYQPFNEALRAIYPFVSSIKKMLKPGDIILDTWCRTGWTGELLAGLFPDNQVVSMWEGDKDTLGFAGFEYWLGEQRRAANLTIVFQPASQPLPFKDKTIRVIIGYESLHRYPHASFLAELERIQPEHGLILFPHVHLSHKDKLPFERGLTQYSAQEYFDYFAQTTFFSHKRAFILSERALFEKQGLPLNNDTANRHYNASIVLAPASSSDTLLKHNFTDRLTEKSRLIINPLLEFNLHQGTISLINSRFAESINTLYQRHPVFYNAVKHLPSVTLSILACQVILLAKQQLTVEAIQTKLGCSHRLLIDTLNFLDSQNVIHVAPVSEAMVRLQSHFSGLDLLPTFNQQTFTTIWWSAKSHYLAKTLIINSFDDSEIQYQDTCQLIARLSQWLLAQDVNKGDTIALVAEPHIESVVTIWTALLMGIIVMPLNPNMPKQKITTLLNNHATKLVFSDTRLAHTPSIPNIIFDTAYTSGSSQHFSTIVNNISTCEITFPDIEESSPAVILLTSGSLGQPKGVMLSHGSLFRSSWTLAKQFQWDSHDRVLTLGGLSTMSGFRNHCIAPLIAGARIICFSSHKHSVLSLVHSIRQHRATQLTTTPSLLNRLLSYQSRLNPQSFHSIKQILSTGAALTIRTKTSIEQWLNIRVFNYYGLTETGGICILTDPNDNRRDASIGQPDTFSLAFILDKNNQRVKPNQAGQLKIFSLNNMLGYSTHVASAHCTLIDTGDQAIWADGNHITLKGRHSERYKNRQGEVVYFSDIEQVVTQHPDIQECCTLNLGQSEEEQHIVSFVSPHKRSANLHQTLFEHATNELGQANQPNQYIVMNELPKTLNGKIDKTALRMHYQYGRLKASK